MCQSSNWTQGINGNAQRTYIRFMGEGLYELLLSRGASSSPAISVPLSLIQMTTYYATTRFYQNGVEFQCSFDLNVASNWNPTDEETISHLASILNENVPETWGFDDEDECDEDCDDEDEDEDAQATLDLQGISPEQFARELVLSEEQSAERYGVTWAISTNWDVVDAENWEHPCNL
jgi:hypothetical protein